jgi:hypothetical protein
VTRTLIKDNGVTRTYEVRDEDGQAVGTDREPVNPPENVQAKFRDAVRAATTLDQLKAAILGDTTNVEPQVRPR